MEKCSMLACYHPTTSLLVDDNKNYLRNIKYSLIPDHSVIQVCNIPMQVVEYFNEQYNFNPFINRCIKHPDEEELEHRLIDIDVRRIHREVYRAERFRQISVIMADYAMPGMNGLEMLKRIDRKKTGPIRKILLTGEADELIAIEAFNAGIIDRYIKKDDRDFNDKVVNTIDELQNEYFADLSQIILSSLVGDYTRAPNCFNDPGLMNYFNKIVVENAIVEYYLMDSFGSYFMLDKNATPSWFIVKTESELRNLYNYALQEDASEEVLHALNSRELIPYFHSDDDLQTPPAQWGKYLHSARLLQGSDLYYCSYIKNSSVYNINAEQILSFAEYQDKDANEGIKNLYCNW